MSTDISNLISRMRRALDEKASVQRKKRMQGYMKDDKPFEILGLRTPDTRKIANQFFRELKTTGIHDINKILEICDDLLEKGVSEYRTIAFQWSMKCKKQFTPDHFQTFERWLNSYVTGWGSTDDLCAGSLGYILYRYPEFIPHIKENWTKSENIWVRRAAAVIFIYSLRREKYLEHIFDIADSLFNDSEMYVLKGYGWVLKEGSKHYQQEVFEYVMRKKSTMPRVSLRYAIEKMPEKMRKQAMSKP